MSGMLLFVGAILIYGGLTNNSDIDPHMRPWSVVIGGLLAVAAVVVYLVRDHESDDF